MMDADNDPLRVLIMQNVSFHTQTRLQPIIIIGIAESWFTHTHTVQLLGEFCSF